MNASVPSLLLCLFIASTPAFASSVQIIHESMSTRAVAQEGGADQGTSQDDIYRETDRVRLVEVRTSAKGVPQRVEVEFDPATLVPISWSRRIGDGAIHTDLRVANGEIEARTYDGGAVTKVSTVAVPDEPWCVAPLVKFLAARCMIASGTVHRIRTVAVTEDGALKVAEMRLEDLGSIDITVPAGEFRCRQLRLTPKSKIVSAFMPAGELFIAEDGTHPLIKTVIPPTPISQAIETVLESYAVETNGPAGP